LGAGHLESAREAYLRASTYFRTAEFYLHGDPGGPRILSESRASQQAYAEAAKLTGPTWEPVQIPYEGRTLPGYFYKVDNSDKPRPTLIFFGGFDSSLEELFYFGGAPAVRRGYNCLTFDGPGQGAPIREQKRPFRYDWEAVVIPAVDYALTRPDVDGANLALKGTSLGGYFAARAVAFEHRPRVAIFFDGLYDFHESLRGAMPKEAIAALDDVKIRYRRSRGVRPSCRIASNTSDALSGKPASTSASSGPPSSSTALAEPKYTRLAPSTIFFKPTFVFTFPSCGIT
jgi:pimeloyl-ACP methyl ester carboxylesterase